MTLTNESKYLLDFFLKKNLSNIKETKISKDCFLYIYNIFLNYTSISYERIIKRKKNNKLLDGPFLSRVIKNYINNNKSNCVIYKFKLFSGQINLYYYSFTDKLDIQYLDNYTNYVAMILYLLSLHSSNECNKELDISIYLTPFTRNLSSELNSVIGVDNVNGGYTYFCQKQGSIVIYRKEEWLKVLIHECFHSFGLEFSNLDLRNLNSEIKKLFPINSEINIFEAYVEIWAEIINVCLISFLFSNGNSKVYLHYLYNFLIYEREFSIFQSEKILYYNKMTYKDLFKNGNNYKENTNIFPYYIIKSLLMENINEFIEWCFYNNRWSNHLHGYEDINYFNFKKDEKTLNLFLKFIKKISIKRKVLPKNNFNLLFKNSNNSFILKNLRMTAIEI